MQLSSIYECREVKTYLVLKVIRHAYSHRLSSPCCESYFSQSRNCSHLVCTSTYRYPLASKSCLLILPILSHRALITLSNLLISQQTFRTNRRRVPMNSAANQSNSFQIRFSDSGYCSTTSCGLSLVQRAVQKSSIGFNLIVHVSQICATALAAFLTSSDLIATISPFSFEMNGSFAYWLTVLGA